MPLVGIRTRNPRKPADADPHLRPRGHWDRQKNLFTTKTKSVFKIRYMFRREISSSGENYTILKRKVNGYLVLRSSCLAYKHFILLRFVFLYKI